MTAPAPIISVTEPLSWAFARMKLILFQPFVLERWFVIGFCAWLAELGSTGGNFNFNMTGGRNQPKLKKTAEEAWDYIQANLDWILPLAIGIVLLLLALWVLMVWLSSRGQFMFLHCVTGNVAEVRAPWHRYRAHGSSLFRFRLALVGLTLVVSLPGLAILGLLITQMVRRGAPDTTSIVVCVSVFLFVVCVGIVMALAQKLTSDFVVPIMWLRTPRCVEAWREFLRLLAGHKADLALYVIFQIVLHLGASVALIFVGLATCCVGFCLLAVPYLGTVVSLPLPVFFRSYSLYYLAQYGDAYNVFAQSQPPSAPVPPAPAV